MVDEDSVDRDNLNKAGEALDLHPEK